MYCEVVHLSSLIPVQIASPPTAKILLECVRVVFLHQVLGPALLQVCCDTSACVRACVRACVCVRSVGLTTYCTYVCT